MDEPRPDNTPWFTGRSRIVSLLAITASEVVAWGIILAGYFHPLYVVAALGLHGLAVAGAGGFPGATRSQRALMAALTFGLPLLGASVAFLVLGTRRRGELATSLPAEGDAP